MRAVKIAPAHNPVNYYPPDWQKKSKQVREIAGNRCQICYAPASYLVLHACHAFSPARNGDHSEDNLRCFCARCHAIWDWSRRLRARRRCAPGQLDLFVAQGDLFGPPKLLGG